MLHINTTPTITSFIFDGDDKVPNSHLSVVLFKAAFGVDGSLPKSELKKIINARTIPNGWEVDWVDYDAVYRYPHYHSNAHEVLMVLDDVGELRLGGANGGLFKMGPGDLVAIPAGVAHQRIHGSRHFRVAGLYPKGPQWNIHRPTRETQADYQRAKANIAKVPLPLADPFYGSNGPLINHWK